MINHFDHITIVVRDVERAKEFFRILGFKEDMSVTISGKKFSAYMGVDDIDAEHVTLVLPHVAPRLEVQLLKYNQPGPIPDHNITNLSKIGFNHICFAVDDIEAEVEKLKSHGIRIRNKIMNFHSRKLVFVFGPEDVTIELSEWH